LDYNLYFANGTHCTACSGGLGANSKTEDPKYLDFANGDFGLALGSGAIDGDESDY
jgi:hypothetical protein